jgi:BirA family biotin operon repressor/biotin-[acetyl-CoA-carboxylase] ligase
MDQRNKKIIYLNEVESTNNYANQLILSDAAEEGTVVLAQYQTHGKGQHGNVWESETGKNLLMSIIWHPGFLPASQQFMISKIVSIAITDCVNDIIDDCKIKWPNDIYIGNQKLAGILIENSVKGSHLSSSVVGIGLNVNQQVFISAAPNPVSLFQITGVIYEISELMEKLLMRLNFWYNELLNEQTDKINRVYLSRLYRYHEWSLFTDSDKQKFEARIINIGKFGQLILELPNNVEREYMFKEIEYVL